MLASRLLSQMRAGSSRALSTSSVVYGRDLSRPRSLAEYREVGKAVSPMERMYRGERSFEWGDGRGNDAEVMPTLETHKEVFNGIVYDDLPIVHIKATKNNTLVKFTDARGEYITSTSARMEGFKNCRKKTEVAAQTTGMAAGVRALRRGVHTVRVRIQGLGHGRLAAPKGMALSGVNIVSITDHTPMPETSRRPKKMRRI